METNAIFRKNYGSFRRFFSMLGKAKLPYLWIIGYLAANVVIANVGVSTTEYSAALFAGNVGLTAVVLPYLFYPGASGAAAADGRAAAFREFPLTDGNGTASQAVGNLPNGWYVAEDAAGNRSAPLKVSGTEPPSVDRPSGSVVDPGDPGYAPPVGPPLGPGSDPVPGPTVKEDGA